MNILEVMKYCADLSVFETLVFVCETEEDYNILYNYGALYWFAGGNPGPKELRTHDVLSLIEDDLKFIISE